MTDDYNPVARLGDLPRDSFDGDEHYGSEDAVLGDRLRLTALGAVYTVLPPGKSACPCHVHHAEDEMFVILEGEGSYRFGDKVYEVQAGDVLGAPIGGAEYAHKLTNTGEGPLGYVVVSSKAAIDVCEYPDSGKFLVRSDGTEKFTFIGRRETSLDYWEGE